MLARILTLAALLLAGTAHAAAGKPCDWTHPGANPFRGSVVRAIIMEPSLTWADSAALVFAYMKLPAERIHIWRDGITGERGGLYSPHLTGMRFGRDSRCEEVDRSRWPELHGEDAKAWCTGEGKCLALPDVCGNPVFIRRLEPPTGLADKMGTVPEPGTLALVGVALAAGLLASRGGRP